MIVASKPVDLRRSDKKWPGKCPAKEFT